MQIAKPLALINVEKGKRRGDCSNEQKKRRRKCSNKHQKLVFAYSKWFGCSPPTTCRVNERQAVDRALCVTQALGLLMWKERKQGLNPQKGKWGKSVIQNGHCQAFPLEGDGGTSHNQSPKESWYKRREVFLHRKKILAFQRLQMVAIPGHISDPNNGRKHRSKTFSNNNWHVIRTWWGSKHVYSMLVMARRSTKKHIARKMYARLVAETLLFFVVFLFCFWQFGTNAASYGESLWTALCGESWWKISNRMKSPRGSLRLAPQRTRKCTNARRRTVGKPVGTAHTCCCRK